MSEGTEACVRSGVGGFVSHRAAGAESGRSTGECWPRWSCNFLSAVCVGFAPAERHPETQLLALSRAQASEVITMGTVGLAHTLTGLDSAFPVGRSVQQPGEEEGNRTKWYTCTEQHRHIGLLVDIKQMLWTAGVKETNHSWRSGENTNDAVWPFEHQRGIYWRLQKSDYRIWIAEEWVFCTSAQLEWAS